MAIRCKICGRCVEPSDKAIEFKVCGFCSGKYSKDTPECFDGSLCERPDNNCNQCKWMRSGGL